LAYCVLPRDLRAEISKYGLAVLLPAHPSALQFACPDKGASARKNETRRSNPSLSSNEDQEPYQR